MSTQSRLSSLALVRLLQAWAPAPAGEPPRQDVAQRLGEWLSAFDSVQLDGALQAIASYGAARRSATGPRRDHMVDGPALVLVCRDVEKGLADLIGNRLSAAASLATTDAAQPETDYTPHLQRYLDLQKQMETRVAACRAHVRQVLGKGSPRLRQLAALDKVMADMLGEREQKLLAAVPVYLERRFTHWRQADQLRPQTQEAQQVQEAHQARFAQGEVAAHEADARPWLAGFRQDMRQMLLAELQARLQPVLGLIEAAQADARDTGQGSDGRHDGRDGGDGKDSRQMDRHPA